MAPKSKRVTRWRGFAAALLLLPALPLAARDVTGLYRASVAVNDRTPAELKRGTTAALVQVLVKLSGNRRIPGDANVQPLVAKAATLVLQYTYASAADGGLLLTAEFDEQALVAELEQRGVAVWGKARPETLAWLIVDDGSTRQLVGGDEPGTLGDALLRHSGLRAVPLLLPLLDIEESSALNAAKDWPAIATAARGLSQRYATPATLVGYLAQSAANLWEAHWQLVVGSDELEWSQQGDVSELMVEEGVDALGDALARRFADPTVLAGAEQLSLTVSGVRTAADYARLSTYLDSLDTIARLFVKSVDNQHVLFDVTARGGRAALAQSIAFGQVLAPTPGAADAYELQP